jgi:hypothetical protein
LWEAPVFTERTSVGLDVHARSVVAAAIDGVTGIGEHTITADPTISPDARAILDQLPPLTLGH